MADEPKDSFCPEDKEELELIFADLLFFVFELIKDYGEPVSPSKEEIERLKADIVNNPINDIWNHPKNFYLIERVEGDILFSHNVDRYLGLNDGFNLMEFHASIGDGITGWHYLKEYFEWGKIAYLFFQEIGKVDDLLRYTFKIHLPMKCADGNVYWVLQQSRPLEFDANKNMLSHINTYTISRIFEANERETLRGEFYCDDKYCNEWNRQYAEGRKFVRPLIFSAVQKEIVLHFYRNPKATLKECAYSLKYPLNTIKKYVSDCQHKSGIIDKAKLSFPLIEIKNLKDVVLHLTKIGLITDWIQDKNHK